METPDSVIIISNDPKYQVWQVSRNSGYGHLVHPATESQLSSSAFIAHT